jgi:hypothetical protein
VQIEEYKLHYEGFDREFCPQASLEDVEAKMLEELTELNVAIRLKMPLADKINEALDCMNMSHKLLRSYGVLDTLDAGILKLELTARKYREQLKK